MEEKNEEERQKNKPRNSTATQKKKKKNSNWKNTAKTDITTLKFSFMISLNVK